jgi:hypothetical protein
MPVVSAVRAGAACFGMGRTATYQSIHDGTFPVECIRAGGRWVVATSPLCELLGLSADEVAHILETDDAENGGLATDCDAATDAVGPGRPTPTRGTTTALAPLTR